MFSIVQPISNVAVVVGVYVLSFTTFDALEYFPLIFFSVAEEVDAVALQSIFLPLTSIYVSFSVVINAFSLALHRGGQFPDVLGVVGVSLFLHSWQQFLRAWPVNDLLLDFLKVGLILLHLAGAHPFSPILRVFLGAGAALASLFNVGVAVPYQNLPGSVHLLLLRDSGTAQMRFPSCIRMGVECIWCEQFLITRIPALRSCRLTTFQQGFDHPDSPL